VTPNHGEGARPDALETVKQLRRLEDTTELGEHFDHEPAPLPELGIYGGQPAVRCLECGHVSPSQLHLDRHLLRQCCGRLGRAA
jgi:hypothetical protein